MGWAWECADVGKVEEQPAGWGGEEGEVVTGKDLWKEADQCWT